MVSCFVSAKIFQGKGQKSANVLILSIGEENPNAEVQYRTPPGNVNGFLRMRSEAFWNVAGGAGLRLFLTEPFLQPLLLMPPSEAASPTPYHTVAHMQPLPRR